MKNDLQELKFFLRDYVNSITKPSKGKQYVCPLCGSGTHDNKSGAFSIDKDEIHWRCFSCEKHGDIYDLCKEHEHVDAAEAARIIAARYGQGGVMTVKKTAQTSSGSNQNHDKAAAGTDPEPKRDIAGEINRYAAALENSPGQEYLEGRGITLETMKRFNLGYSAGGMDDYHAPMITIPYNAQGTYYEGRTIKGKNHIKLKNVPAPIFNMAALYADAADFVFIVESPLCAISIMQAGGAAVALGGTSGAEQLCKRLKEKPTKAALIICLDNDDPGRKGTESLMQALEETGYQHIIDGTAAIMGEATDKQQDGYRKDPNDVLKLDGAKTLKAAVNNAIEDFKQAIAEAEAERAAQRGAAMVDSFLRDIQTDKYQPIPTGISGIDRALQGGFMRQQLIILGAAPGAGKTSLAQWIFENMAKQGITSTIYLNLEMSREQLLARSISRIATQRGTAVNPLDVMRGYRWTDEQSAAIQRAAEIYKQEIAPRFSMNPAGITADLDTILAYMNQEAMRAEQEMLQAPAVVIDYLQLITGMAKEDAAATIKRAVAAFKHYAIDHNTLVFCIIAHNRSSNSSGSVSMEAARDTSAIEYSADIQLALTFKACMEQPDDNAEDEEETDKKRKRRKKPKLPSQLTKAERKDLVLRVVKGRFGGAGTDVDLHFDGDTMTFKEPGVIIGGLNKAILDLKPQQWRKNIR